MEDHHHKLLKSVNIKQLFMLLSVSLFSLVFSSLNCRLSFLQPTLNSDSILTFPFRLLTHGIDKNCIFLLCNGILVFLAKSSGLIMGSRFRSSGYTYPHKKQAEPQVALDVKPQAFEYTDERLSGDLRGSDYSPMENTDRYFIEQVNKENEESAEGCETSKEEELTSVLVGRAQQVIEEHEIRVASIEEEFDESDQTRDYQMEELEHDTEAEEDVMFGSKILSTEELNKKFDEFIRRMKEDIRIEDEQQLVRSSRVDRDQVDPEKRTLRT